MSRFCCRLCLAVEGLPPNLAHATAAHRLIELSKWLYIGWEEDHPGRLMGSDYEVTCP
jgi:hypothetical protein